MKKSRRQSWRWFDATDIGSTYLVYRSRLQPLLFRLRSVELGLHGIQLALALGEVIHRDRELLVGDEKRLLCLAKRIGLGSDELSYVVIGAHCLDPVAQPGHVPGGLARVLECKIFAVHVPAAAVSDHRYVGAL